MTSYKVAFIKTDAFQKKVAGKNYYEGYDNQVEGSAPIFNFYFTEDYTRSWDSGNPFSYSSLRNGEIESIDYDSSKLTVKFLNYDTFSYDEKVYEVGVPTTDEKIVDPSDHSKLFEFTPTEIFVGDSLNSDDPITETMRDSVMEFEQNKGKIPKMAETFEARTTRKSRKWDDETGKGNIEMKPDGKQSGLRGYDRSPKGTSDSKLDWDSANDANTKIKANLRGKEDLRDFKKHGMAEYVACAECGDDVYELESNTCCEECNDNLNEAFEWIAKENGEENLRDFMDSIDITDDDLNAENVKIDWDAVAKEEWELGYPHDDDLLSYQNKQANKSLLSCLNSYLKVAKDVATMGHYDYPDLTEYTITPAYEKAYGRRPTSAEIDEALPKVIKGLRKQAKTGKLAGVDDWEELSKALKSPLSQYTWGQGYEGSYGNKGRKGWFTNDDNYEPLNAETFNADYTKGYTDVTEKIQSKDKYGRPKETVVQSLTGYAGNCPSCDKRINFPIGGGGLYCNDCQVYLLPSREKGLNKTLRYDAETFDAKAKWAGFCPFCKKWRTDEMSKEMKGEIVCGKKIASPNSYGGDMEAFNRENFERKGGKWLRSNSICSVVLEEKPTYYNAEEFNAEHYMKYFDELENLYGRQNFNTYNNLGSIAYKSLYMAARNLGATPIEAFNLCNSKWIRHNEDDIPNNMTEMFMNMMYRQGDNWKHYIEGDGDYQIEDYSMNTLWKDMRSGAENRLKTNKSLGYDAENEVFNANAKSGDKVYVITRRCEDYSAYRELDVAIFGSKTEAKKKFNYLFKEEKEQNYPDETIADAKSYMRWGDVGWGIESFMAGDMIYELNEHTVGNKGDFYFDAEGDSQ